MILTIRKIISNILYYSGITYLAYKIGTKKIIILAYHRLLDLNPEFELDTSVISASIDNFKKQIEYLSRRYNVISLEKFLEYYKKKKNPPKNSVVITFDDGYRDNYLFAYPLLKKYNFPATIFLVTEAIDQKQLFWWDKLAYIINRTKIENFQLEGLGNYSLENKNKRLKVLKKIQYKLKKMNEFKKNLLIGELSRILKVSFPDGKKTKKMLLSWNEIEEMSKNNISFGAHTMTHPILTKIPIEKAKEEIQESKDSIEKKINKNTLSFCYPNGEQTDFNDEIKQVLKESGFECAVTYILGWNNINSDLFELRRMAVGYDEDIILFKNKLIGIDVILNNFYFLLNRVKKK